MNRIVLMAIGILTIVLFVVSTFSQAIECYGPQNLDGKVKEADLIVFGSATGEGEWVPSNPGPSPHFYRQQCRIVVMEVLWPHNPSLTNDIVVSLILHANWPTSSWNYTNTTGIFFFKKTPTIAEQKAELRQSFGEAGLKFEEIKRNLPEDIRNELSSRTVKEGPFDTNKWSRLGRRADDWLEPATNAPMIRELIGKMKESLPNQVPDVINSEQLIEIARHNTLSNNLVLLNYYYGNELNARKLGNDDQIKNAVYRLINPDVHERYTNCTIRRTLDSKVISTNTIEVLSSFIIRTKSATNYAAKYEHKNVKSNNYETILEKRTVQGVDVLIPIKHVLKSFYIDMAPFIDSCPEPRKMWQ